MSCLQVNLKVGQTLAKGLEKSEEVTEKVQETVGSKSKEAKLKADEHAENARHKANKASSFPQKLRSQLIENAARQAATGAHQAKEDLKRNVKE